MKKICLLLALLGVLPVSGRDLLSDLNPAAVRSADGKAELIQSGDRKILKLSGVSQARAGSVNAYLQMDIALPQPLDLTGKSISFRVSSQHPEHTAGLYVRAFANDGGRPIWSFSRWNVGLPPAADRAFFVLTPGQNGRLHWEGREAALAPTRPAAILRFIIGTRQPGVPLDLEVSDLALIPARDTYSGTALPPDFLRELSGVKQLARTFGRGAELDFPDGDASISFARGDEENKYAGLMFTLNRPVDLTGKSLRFKVRGDHPPGGFYLRAYNAGEKKPVWSFASWSSVTTREWKEIFFQHGSASAGFSWEDATVVPDGKADRVDRLELIIGTRNRNERIDLRFRGPVAGEEREALTSLKTVAALPKATVLAADTAIDILHPHTLAGRHAAEELADALHGLAGVRVTCRPGTAADRLPGATVFMLGNIYSNPAMLTLYARGFTLADETFPGPGGYLVESVTEPFRRGADVLLLGASDDAGLAAGTAELIARLRTGSRRSDGAFLLPHFFRSRYADARFAAPPITEEHLSKGLDEARHRLQTGRHTSLGGYLAEIGERYRLYRRQQDAKLYVEVAKLYAESARSDPRKFGGPWGFDSDFRSFAAIGMWDIVEHDPILSDDDRLQTTNMICRWLLEAIADEAAGGRSGKGTVSNHLTFASLGTLMGSFYLGKYYGDLLEEPKAWEEIARCNFARQSDSMKAHDDCNGYQWLTWHHLLLYSVATPDDTFFANGTARKVIESLLLTMDNLGYQVPYGDTGSWKCWNSEVVCLDLYYAATRDPLAAYLLDVKRKVHPNHTPGNFRAKLGRVETPTGFNGVAVLPLDRKYYLDAPPKNGPAPENAFDKISFREKLDPAAFYLLLDGVNNGGHKHADANSVLRHTQFNRIWLADNDYFKSQQKFHNTLLVTADGASFPLPDFMELLDRGANNAFGWTSTRANSLGPNFNWTRHLVQLKAEQAYLVIDEVGAREAASLILKQRWHGVGEIDRTPDGALLRQKGPVMRFQGEPGSRYAYFDDEELGANWTGYPHAPRVVRVIDQIAAAPVPAGGTARIAGVWHGRADGEEPGWRLERTPDGYRLDTGTRAYAISFAGGKLALAETSSSGPSAPPPAAAVAGGEALPAMTALWNDVRRSGKLYTFNAPAAAKLFPFKLSGTEPAARNILVQAAANRLSSVCDGSWREADDSVMFDRDRRVEITFDFETPAELSRVRLHQWWSAASSTSDRFLLKKIRLFLDGEELSVRDTAGETHPNFGRPVGFDFEFPPRRARSVRLELTPQEGSRIYLAEVEIQGPAPLDRKLPDQFIELTALKALTIAGRPHFAVGTAEGQLLLYADDGKPVAKFELKSRINAIEAADLDGDGKAELLVALEAGKLLALRSGDGSMLWNKTFEFYRRHPAVRVVTVADLDGDGRLTVLAGCDNWRTYALTADGEELWHYEVIHPARAVTAADLDGDGSMEVLCGTIYYQMNVLDIRGLLKWRAHFGPGCRSIVAPKPGRGKVRHVVAGSDNGTIYFFNGRGGKLGEFITGDEVRVLAVATPDADGGEDVFAGSFNGLVYRFAPGGKLKFYAEMPAGVTAVKALPGGELLAGGSDGTLRVFSAAGKARRELKLNGEIAAVEIDREGRTATAITRHGEVVKFNVK